MSHRLPSLTDELLWCENVWCGLEFAPADGWGGLCPSCLTLVDEHLGSGHEDGVAECVECRRVRRLPAHLADTG